MGNPHAVTFDVLGDARFEIGPASKGEVAEKLVERLLENAGGES